MVRFTQQFIYKFKHFTQVSNVDKHIRTYNYIKIARYKDTSRKIHFLDQKIILHSINWAAKASLKIAHRLMSRRKMAKVTTPTCSNLVPWGFAVAQFDGCGWKRSFAWLWTLRSVPSSAIGLATCTYTDILSFADSLPSVLDFPEQRMSW